MDPVEGARNLAALQQDLVARTRLGVPAIAHDECLTGFTTFGATVFPTALAWAATFDPELVERMTRAIGGSMHAVGVHQGLSPVLDVVRDYRWGRVEETLGEDPYLAGVIGTAYVRGLESCGVVATLKHFVGYSASQAARNHAPVAIGPRALRDVLLPPFEMAVREGGARSVMNSYSDIDGLPVAADAQLLTGVLRDEWGFEGVVVSDYWAIAFVQIMHRVAGSAAEAGALALRAGIDVELPHVRSYGEPLAGLVRDGTVPEELVDRGGAARAAPEGRARAARRRLVARVAGAWPRARSTSTRRPTARSRASSPRRRSSCWSTTGRCRSTSARERSRSSGPAPTTRSPSSAATRSPTTASCRATRSSGSASRSRRSWTACARSCPTPRSCTSRAARSRSPTGRGCGGGGRGSLGRRLHRRGRGSSRPVRARHLG